MNTYEEFMIILAFAGLIVHILPGRGALTSLAGCLVKYIICQHHYFVKQNRPLRQQEQQLFQLNVIHFSILYFFMNFCLPG